MSTLKHLLWNHRNFLQNYRNIMKLKDVQFRTLFISTGSDYAPPFVPISVFPTYLQSGNKLANISCSNVCCMSRWSKYSANSIFTNHISRKKYRSEQLADKLRARILSAKRETRKRVHKKINEIKENVLTVPNALCVLRIGSAPLLAYLVISEHYTAALSVFVFAGFTDLIDGYIARNFRNQQSMIGSFLDPAADKLLIATLFITLTMNNLIPVPLTSLIIFRDACLFGAGFYIRYVSLPPPKTLTRYFDMSFVTAKLQPTTISKANTMIQLSLVAASLAAPVFGYVDHLYLQILWYITGTTTVLSAASYLYYKNSTFKLFNPSNERDGK